MYTRYSTDDQVGIIRQDSMRDVYYLDFFNGKYLAITAQMLEHLCRHSPDFSRKTETIDGEVITNELPTGPKELTQ